MLLFFMANYTFICGCAFICYRSNFLLMNIVTGSFTLRGSLTKCVVPCHYHYHLLFIGPLQHKMASLSFFHFSLYGVSVLRPSLVQVAISASVFNFSPCDNVPLRSVLS